MSYNHDSYYRGKTEITPGGVIALIISIGILLLIGVPVSDKGTIERFGWQYAIDLEELRDVDRSGWYLPEGATLKYTREEVKETKTEKVRVGQDSDGRPKYAEVEVEVKATKYYYTIKDWCYVTTYVESGFGKEGMHFPEVNVIPCDVSSELRIDNNSEAVFVFVFRIRSASVVPSATVYNLIDVPLAFKVAKVPSVFTVI